MMLLHEAIQAKKFDVRVMEKNLARNVVTDKEVADLAKSLPDDGDNAIWVSLDDLAQHDGQD